MKRSSVLFSVSLFITISLSAQESGIVRFRGHYISPSGGAYTAGCWGWTDSVTGREYALLGNKTGTAVVEITNPEYPIERAFVPTSGLASNWREIQTHSHYAYVVSEGGGGTQIIDLSYLPDSVHLVKSFVYTHGDSNTSRAHTIHVQEGFMYLNGCAKWPPGGIVMFSLADPENPTYLSVYRDHYIHDCFVYHDTAYAAAIQNGGADVIDLTDKSHPQLLYRILYSGAGTHNCATTTDGRFLLTTDEINSPQKDLKIWDVHHAPAYTKVAEYQGYPSSIIHNVFVKDTFAVMSYYTAGMKIVSIADPTQPRELGGYDTYSGPNGQYNGAWSVYPYFPSGNIIIGDMATGLYIVDLAPYAPMPMTNVKAYSDYATPMSVHLQWNDPTQLKSGGNLTDYTIHIYRDRVLVAVVDSGGERFDDLGLTLHQYYTYSLRAVTVSDSSSPVEVSVYAGGAAQSDTVMNVITTDNAAAIRLSWKNPSTQIDGTPLNDLAAIEILRDDTLLALIPQTPLDTGITLIYVDTTTGYHTYKLRVRDNEFHSNVSAFTASHIGYAGVNYSYDEGFENGRGAVYRLGTWDTTHTIAYQGSASITDSRAGNYNDNSSTYILLPPVIIGQNVSLTFTHIAIIAWGDIGLVEVSIDHYKTFMAIQAYNMFAYTQWMDGKADSADWATETIRLADYVGDTVAVRFRLLTNGSTTSDGWYIDDIFIEPVTGVADDGLTGVQQRFSLEQNFPNPFNPTTELHYQISQASNVEIKIYDLLGEEVASIGEGAMLPGRYSVQWNAEGLSNGVYFARLSAIDRLGRVIYRETKKLLLVK